MKLFRKAGTVVNTVGGGITRAGFNLVGSAVERKYTKTGQYIKEVGDTVVHSSQTVIKNAAHFADGATNGAYGFATKNDTRKADGWDDVKTSTRNTAKGIVGGLKYTGRSIGDTVVGAATKDQEKMTDGMKNLGKVVTVATVGISVADLVIPDTVETMELETRNMTLDGEIHDVTGVTFQSKIVENEAGHPVEGVFPVFDAAFEMELPQDILQSSDALHIRVANLALYEEIQNNPQLADDLGFTAYDVEHLKNPITPEGYDWHHHEDIGKMQLVDEATHQQTAHTGRRYIWGGGTESR